MADMGGNSLALDNGFAGKEKSSFKISYKAEATVTGCIFQQCLHKRFLPDIRHCSVSSTCLWDSCHIALVDECTRM